ncbi:MAG: hypothetical protein ABJC13_17335 [Acidobacteriota bacterium]
MIERTPGFATWALVEKLAHQSEKAAARDVEEALALGELGVWTADRLPDTAAFQAEAREYAWIYIGNAGRVKGLFDEAFAAFARAKEVAPPEGEAFSPFSRARMLDREASLHREKRQFVTALDLQDRAFEVARPEERGFLWLSRALLFQQDNNPEGAISALQNACAALDERSEPRDRWGALFSLGVNLVELNRGGEAEALLPQIRSLAELRRDSLDLLRVLWLEGKAARARFSPLGRPQRFGARDRSRNRCSARAALAHCCVARPDRSRTVPEPRVETGIRANYRSEGSHLLAR